VASKVAALNAGDGRASHFPRFYVDADVELPLAAVRRVAQVLDDGAVMCAAPRPVFELEGRPWAVRAFYDVWKGIPYHTEEMVGSGVYALSAEGRGRFGAFPELTADDQFVQQLFLRSERRAVPDAHFVVHTPRKVHGLLAMRARAYRGNIELAGSGLAQASPPPSGAKSALRQALDPAAVPAVAVYAGINLYAKLLARRAVRPRWERDESARSAAAPHSAPGGTAGYRREAAGRCADDAGEAPSRRAAKVCYVTSHYPALSHTFVMREVQGLRAAGVEVETASVHQADRAHLLAQADIEEAARTWNIFPLDRTAFCRAHARALLGHPVAYWRALASAVGWAPPGLRGALWQVFYFAEAIALWDHARAVGARHLHAHLANVASDIAWLATAFGADAEPSKAWRWSFTMHGSTEFYSVARFNLARKVANAGCVICVSEYTRSQLMYLSTPEHWAKLHVVHCGVDPQAYPYVPPPKHTGVSVLCVSRLAAGKGIELLISATAVLGERGTDARLVIVGSGPVEADLRRQAERLGIADRVSLEGAVGQDDIARYYAEADIFCLPSFAEGVPVVLMEAMATGRPVVTTWITGVPELVESGVSGLLVPPGSLEALTGALERLAASPEMREQFGLAGRRRVSEGFDSGQNAAQLARVFGEAPWARPGQA
jgi:glycosyltransferase involved in cell wall biosynthesis